MYPFIITSSVNGALINRFLWKNWHVIVISFQPNGSNNCWKLEKHLNTITISLFSAMRIIKTRMLIRGDTSRVQLR